MHLNFSNLRPRTRMYSTRYKIRISVKLKYKYTDMWETAQDLLESRTGVSGVAV